MSTKFHSVIYSVSVRLENWKLNLMMNLRLSLVQGIEVKT